VRRAQTTVEYMLIISVVVLAIYFVMYVTLAPFPTEVKKLGDGLTTSLTKDGIQ